MKPPPDPQYRHRFSALPYLPRVIVTDKLRSYGVAQRQVLLWPLSFHISTDLPVRTEAFNIWQQASCAHHAS